MSTTRRRRTRAHRDRSTWPGYVDNQRVADVMAEVATLLDEQQANPFRAQAWRDGASTMRALGQDIADLLDREGVEGLDRLPRIGPALAGAIAELVETGRLGTLDRLRGEGDPEAVLASVSGIGPVLAKPLHQELGLDTLEELEVAAHDGRLEDVPGLGARRVQGIREVLASRLARRRASLRAQRDLPPVAELLDVDREYRKAAERGTLRTIAPRRFNPSGDRWLPILHTERGERNYTALFSNSALAHKAHATLDWVVLYHDGREGEQRYTVVTAHDGPLRGRRIVRGREQECLRHYGLA